MREFLRKDTIDFDKELTGTVTPSRNYLQSVDPNSPPADENRIKKFYSAVILIICVSQRGRRDLEPAVSLFSQRVHVCTEEDRAKLRRSARYVKETIDELPYLGASDLSVIINFIDAVHGACDDHKS